MNQDVNPQSEAAALAHYHQLSPETVIQAFEQSTGLVATGRVSALNSLENRVYEIEVESDTLNPASGGANNFLVAKFYRPGRWSAAQILEEHEFLLDLAEREIPVVAPNPFLDQKTLHKIDDADIYYTVFPKRSGRCLDEFTVSQVETIGRLLARIHAVGEIKPCHERITLNPEIYGRKNLCYLLEHKLLPFELEARYSDLVTEICDITSPWFEEATYQRIHGDCHIGNLIDRDGEFCWIDFDDMVNGPCVQDLWLIAPGRDSHSKALWQAMLTGYESFHEFDYRTLRLIEPLRALRFIHFSAWIAKRSNESAFIKAFPLFNQPQYWHSQVQDLAQQLALIKQPSPGNI